MLHTGTSAQVLSTYLLHTAWHPRGLLLGSMNAHRLMRNCCPPCRPLSPSTTSSVLPSGRRETQCFMLIVLKLPCLDQVSCSLTLMHPRSFPPLGLWMMLALLWPLCHCPFLALLKRALDPSPRSLYRTCLLSLPPRGEPLMMTFALRKLSFTHQLLRFRRKSSRLLATPA